MKTLHHSSTNIPARKYLVGYLFELDIAGVLTESARVIGTMGGGVMKGMFSYKICTSPPPSGPADPSTRPFFYVSPSGTFQNVAMEIESWAYSHIHAILDTGKCVLNVFCISVWFVFVWKHPCARKTPRVLAHGLSPVKKSSTVVMFLVLVLPTVDTHSR